MTYPMLGLIVTQLNPRPLTTIRYGQPSGTGFSRRVEATVAEAELGARTIRDTREDFRRVQLLPGRDLEATWITMRLHCVKVFDH